MDFVKKDKVVVLIDTEVTYGTDTVPVGANALLTRDFTLSPIEGSEVQRQLDRQGMGASPSLFAGEHMTCSFKVEAAPSGTVAVPPAFSPVLLAGQMNETITPITGPVDYAFVSSGFDSATLYANLDGILYRLLGLRGAVGIEFEGGGIPYFTFNGMALLTLPSDTPAPAGVDYSAFELPELAEDDSTQEIRLNTIDLVLRSFTANAPGNVNFRDLPGQKEVVVAGDRNFRSRLEVMMPTLATFDPVALKAARTLVPFSLLHGTGAGSQWHLTSPTVQVVGVTQGEHQGERTWQLDLLHTESAAGDDEMLLSFL